MLSIGLGVGVGGGPSRMVLRRLAAHSRPVLVPRTGAAPTLASLRLLSTSTPVLAVQRPAARSKQPRQLKDVRNQLSETEWPWRPLPNGEEERVIFSRPVTTDPRMMWVFAVLWLGGVVTWVVMPSDRETSEYIAKQFPDAPKAEPWTFLGIPQDMLRTWVLSGAITATTLMGLGAALLGSRLVTRLSLVRKAGEKTVNTIRMRTMGQEMIRGSGKGGRDIPRSECSTNLVLGRPLASGARERTSWLSLWVHSPGSASRLNKDHYSYRLDFKDSARLDRLTESGAEVVLSVRRVEDVFGTLEPRDKMVQAPPKKK